MKIQTNLLNLERDIEDFINLLNENSVEYLLVGGYAVAVHGYQRNTKDIDFWIRPSKDNAQKVFKSIKDFGLDFLDFKAEDFEKEDQIFYFGKAPNRVDLITSIEGVNFDDAYKNKIVVEYKGLDISIISDDYLIANKLAAGRPQDIVDASEIKKHKNKKKK